MGLFRADIQRFSITPHFQRSKWGYTLSIYPGISQIPGEAHRVQQLPAEQARDFVVPPQSRLHPRLEVQNSRI